MNPAPSRPAQVLRLLLETDQPRSGQEMGDSLGCSRAAIGKAMNVLREQGFDIQAKSRLGYQLVSEPEAVLAARVEARLEPGGLGIPLWHFDKIDSTNLEARRRAETGAPHGACLVAEFQSAGRGRLERRWQSPAGSCLLFSLILRPSLNLDMVFGLTNLAALGICRALEGLYGLEPKIKWPNDVYLDGVKLAGILTEFTSRAERVESAVVGVGLNVNLTLAQLKKIPAPAASLRQATGKKQDRAILLARILNEISQLYRSFCADQRQEISSQYAERSLLQGLTVSVRDGEKVLQGKALGIAPDGALLLDTPDGKLQIRHGDVTVLDYQK